MFCKIFIIITIMAMEVILSLILGISLSAACGFRIFVPLLIMSIASLAGHLSLNPGFQWIGTYPALIAFALATALEIAAYYIPWLDNLLDSIAIPASIVAGIIVSASCFSGMSPFLKWVLVVVAGGGSAALVQGLTVVARGISSLTTRGGTNAYLSSAEALGSAALSIMAIVVPLIVAVIIIFLIYFSIKMLLFKPRVSS